MAIEYRNFEAADLLVDKNSFLDALDFLGNSVFNYAVKSGNQILILVC